MLDARDRRFLGQGLFAWLFLPLIALLNFLLRNIVLQPLLGSELASMASIAILLLGIYAAAFFLLAGLEPPSSCRVSLLLGAIWVILALMLEGIFIFLSSSHQAGIFSPFSFAGHGGMLAVVLAMLFLAPVICSLTILRR